MLPGNTALLSHIRETGVVAIEMLFVFTTCLPDCRSLKRAGAPTEGRSSYSAGACYPMSEMRRATRHGISYSVTAGHRRLGEMVLDIANISSQGFMANGEISLEPGERVEIRLPEIGRIEAHLVWVHGDRAGFQFERIIRPDAFQSLLAKLEGKQA